METMTKIDMAILVTRASTGDYVFLNSATDERVQLLMQSSREELSYLAYRAGKFLANTDPVEVNLVVSGPNILVMLAGKIIRVFTCPAAAQIVWFRAQMIEWLNAHNYKVTNKDDFNWSIMLNN